MSLAPGLLVSMPQLHDPFFARSVVLMVEHNDEGSFGLIVNQVSDLPVTRLLSALELVWQGDPEQSVWSGGPVMPSSGWVLHQNVDGLMTTSAPLEEALEEGQTVIITDDLFLSSSVTSLRAIAERPPARSKFLLGYAGWAAGQLATEMSRGSWLHAHISREVLFETPAEEMWAGALKSIGVDPEAIIQTRGIH